MAKIGRNQPCPCGSGKKYKNCCLATDETAAASAREEQRRNAPPPTTHGPGPAWRLPLDEGNRLDELSNDAVDLIHAGKLDEAERLCHRLLDDFPDLPDGHMRFGQLFRARGEPKKAAHHLRLAAAVARTGANEDDDLELPRSLEAEADSLDPPAP
jgi:hypothetical protein